MDRIYGVSALLLALPFAAKWEVLIILSQCLLLVQSRSRQKKRGRSAPVICVVIQPETLSSPVL